MIQKLEEILGPPAEVHQLSQNPVEGSAIRELKIAYFAPSGGTGRVVMATSGAYRSKMRDGRRIEAMMILQAKRAASAERALAGPAFDAVRELLSTFVLMPEKNGRTLRYGDVVRADLSAFSAMDALLVVPPLPFPQRFHGAKLKSGSTVDFLWLVPVFASEANYALKYGPSAFMLLAAAQGLDLTDMDRPEANTLAHPSDVVPLAKEATEELLKQARASRPKTPAAKPERSVRSAGKSSRGVKVEQTGSVRVSRRSTGRDRPLG